MDSATQVPTRVCNVTPAIVWIGVVEAAVDEERVCLDPGERSALLCGVCQGAQCEVPRADVVANSKHNPALDVLRNLPQVVVRVAVPDIAVVVVAAGDTAPTLRRGLVEGRLHDPPR